MVKLVAVFHLAALVLSAGTVTSSAECSASAQSGPYEQPVAMTDTGQFSCAAEAISLPVQVHSSVDLGFSETLGLMGFFGVTLHAIATGDFGSYTLARGSIMDAASVSSDGQIRPGFAQLTFSGQEFCSDCAFGATAAASFDQYELYWSGNLNTCTPPPLSVACFAPVTIPVMLGAAHTVTVRADAFATGNTSVSSFGSARASLGFEFFESDGLTPAAWAEAAPVAVPEPATWLLIAVGMVGVLARRNFPNVISRRNKEAFRCSA